MAEIRRIVERIVESDPVIKKGLQRGIINSRALARYILELDGVNSTQDAVLGILRRHPISREQEARHGHVFKDCEIAMRNKIADLAVENGPDIMKRIADFAASLKTTRGENLRVIVGLKCIRVIAEQKTLESFRETLRPKEIISYTTDLAEISLLFAPGAEKIKGIAAKITAQMALNDVNLMGVLCLSPEDILIVEEQYVPRALEALQQLLKEETADHRPSSPELNNSLRASKGRILRENSNGDSVLSMAQNS